MLLVLQRLCSLESFADEALAWQNRCGKSLAADPPDNPGCHLEQHMELVKLKLALNGANWCDRMKHPQELLQMTGSHMIASTSSS